MYYLQISCKIPLQRSLQFDKRLPYTNFFLFFKFRFHALEQCFSPIISQTLFSIIYVPMWTQSLERWPQAHGRELTPFCVVWSWEAQTGTQASTSLLQTLSDESESSGNFLDYLKNFSPQQTLKLDACFEMCQCLMFSVGLIGKNVYSS